jgi:hypothetical protein
MKRKVAASIEDIDKAFKAFFKGGPTPDPFVDVTHYFQSKEFEMTLSDFLKYPKYEVSKIFYKEYASLLPPSNTIFYLHDSDTLDEMRGSIYQPLLLLKNLHIKFSAGLVEDILDPKNFLEADNRALLVHNVRYCHIHLSINYIAVIVKSWSRSRILSMTKVNTLIQSVDTMWGAREDAYLALAYALRDYYDAEDKQRLAKIFPAFFRDRAANIITGEDSSTNLNSVITLLTESKSLSAILKNRKSLETLWSDYAAMPESDVNKLCDATTEAVIRLGFKNAKILFDIPKNVPVQYLCVSRILKRFAHAHDVKEFQYLYKIFSTIKPFHEMYYLEYEDKLLVTKAALRCGVDLATLDPGLVRNLSEKDATAELNKYLDKGIVEAADLVLKHSSNVNWPKVDASVKDRLIKMLWPTMSSPKLDNKLVICFRMLINDVSVFDSTAVYHASDIPGFKDDGSFACVCTFLFMHYYIADIQELITKYAKEIKEFGSRIPSEIIKDCTSSGLLTPDNFKEEDLVYFLSLKDELFGADALGSAKARYVIDNIDTLQDKIPNLARFYRSTKLGFFPYLSRKNVFRFFQEAKNLYKEDYFSFHVRENDYSNLLNSIRSLVDVEFLAGLSNFGVTNMDKCLKDNIDFVAKKSLASKEDVEHVLLNQVITGFQPGRLEMHPYMVDLDQLKRLAPITLKELDTKHPATYSRVKDIPGVKAIGKRDVITKEMVQSIQDALPKDNYTTSPAEWTGAQRSLENRNKQHVIKIRASDAFLEYLDTHAMRETFHEVLDSISHSHPRGTDVLGWVRADISHRDDNGDYSLLIDEIQSDIPSNCDRAIRLLHKDKEFDDNTANNVKKLEKLKEMVEKDFYDLGMQAASAYAKENNCKYLYYHTYEGGRNLKNNGTPPRSVYTDIPKRHHFKEVPKGDNPFHFNEIMFKREARLRILKAARRLLTT